MADDARKLLEGYAREVQHGYAGHSRDFSAPRAFAALRAALDYADDLERLAYDKWMGVAPRDEPRRTHHVAVMETERQASLGIRAAILSALTDSPTEVRDD